MDESTGSGNGKTEDESKKYRPRLSELGKAMVVEQISIIMITNCKNESRAELLNGSFMLCDDSMKNLLPWFDGNKIMEVNKSYIINFRYILNVIPEGEFLRLEMTNGLCAIVSKGHIKEFRRKYKRYNRINS